MTNQDFNNRLSIIVENVVNKALESHFGLVTETLQEKKKKNRITETENPKCMGMLIPVAPADQSHCHPG